MFHVSKAVYNDDGQFQGPGVRTQVPWFHPEKRPLPLMMLSNGYIYNHIFSPYLTNGKLADP